VELIRADLQALLMSCTAGASVILDEDLARAAGVSVRSSIQRRRPGDVEATAAEERQQRERLHDQPSGPGSASSTIIARVRRSRAKGIRGTFLGFSVLVAHRPNSV
jgi:hypothetical protein